ncbi:MAG: mdtK, partial [Gammaproteobacteria bacterium]|nr:mdtK [Gammaproteobacteria bacterium]
MAKVLPTSSSDTSIASRSRSGSSPQRTLVNRSHAEPTSHRELAVDLLKFAGPLAASYDFTWMLVIMTFIIGHLDNDNENNLPANTLISTALNGWVMLLSAAFIAVFLEVSEKRADFKRAQTDPAASQEIVEQKKQAIRAILPNSMALAMVAVPLVALPLYYSKDILVGFNQDEAVAALAQDYLRPYAIGGSTVLLRFILEQYALSYKKQRLAMAVGLASLAIGSGAAYALGQSDGIAGVAWGYNISALLALSGFAAVVGYSSELKNFQLLSSVLDYKSLDSLVMKRLALKGLSFIMMLASEMVSSFALAMMAGNLGTNQLAVQNMVAQLSFFGLIPIFAMSQAISGAISTIMVVPCSVVLASPQLLVAATGTSGLEVSEMANNVLRIQAATMLVDALRQSMLNALRAVGDFA